MIWGTSIMSEDAARDFGSFIRDFKPTMEKLAERRDGRDAWQRSAAEGELPEHLSEELDELDAVAIAEESPYYISVLMSLLDRPSGEGLLNVGINARHLLSFGEIGSRLYTQLTRFPSEIIPLMDMRIQGACALPPFASRHLTHTRALPHPSFRRRLCGHAERAPYAGGPADG